MLQYFSRVLREFSHIRWLTLRRTLFLTVIVIISTFVASFALGAVDGFFARLLKGVVV